MPPRPAIKARQGRPISAIYIGKTSTSPNLQELTQSPHFSSAYPSLIEGTPPALPDLPEPPSPTSSVGSVKTGLPSPPATNSTGSGSTGDPATIRERPISLHSDSSASTASSSQKTVGARSNNELNSRSSSRLGNVTHDGLGADGDLDDNYDRTNDNDNDSNPDGDDTARLDLKFMNRRNEKSKGSSENVMALHRVRTLAQRNRLALDKLSRLGSPSPSRGNNGSPAPSVNSASSSRLSNAPRQFRALPDTPPQVAHELGRSGSETERESTTQYTSTHSSHSSSRSRAYSQTSPNNENPSNRSSTPPPSASQTSSPYHRYRHLSAPGSPNKARSAVGSSGASSVSNSNSNSSSSPSNRRRHRVSVASVSHLQLTDFEEEDDVDEDNLRTATGTRTHSRQKTLSERDLITQSALAAVATSRRSPLGGRRRSALPREFRSDLIDQSPGPLPGSSARKNVEPVTPLRSTYNVGRSSTLRETRRNGDPGHRWSSDDFRSPATVRDRHYAAAHSTDDLHRRERRQSLRGGSAESALAGWSPGGRSLLGEGLRAAGLSRRKDDDRSRGEVSPLTAKTEALPDRSRVNDWSPQEVLDQGRRRVFNGVDRDRQPTRASTSMAQYQYLDRDDEGGVYRNGVSETPLRAHKSSYSLAIRDREVGDTFTSRRERDSLPPERAALSLSRYSTSVLPAHTSSPAPATPAHLLERTNAASPYGSTRRYTTPAAGSSLSTPNAEHTRLLVESLAMFETQLAKLPPQLGASFNSSTGGGPAHGDLSRNAQGAVYAADRLVNLLKHSSARALDAQVAAEVDSATRDCAQQDIIDIWSRVASDYREGSRAADELVRGLTSLLLGVGRVMRDLGATASEMGSPSVYGRNATLADDEADAQHGSGSGRQSVASRHSWEPAPRDRERDREEALRRLDGATRSESVLARASPATFQRLRDREQMQLETPPSASQSSLRSSATTSRTGDKNVVSGTFRRLFTPREQREQKLDASMGKEGPGTLTTMDSQETVHGQRIETPSPTPASKTRPSGNERQRTLTPITIPKPLPSLPSESARRQSVSTSNNSGDRVASIIKDDRRRPSIRAEKSPFPVITSPSNPTTALSPHTVSTSGTDPAPLARTNSERSARSQVTFSRPTTVSVAATLNGIHQQHIDGERQRTSSTSSFVAEPSSSVVPNSIMRSVSGSETERDIKRKGTIMKAPRASLGTLPSERDERDMMTASGTRLSTAVHAADRSAATTILHQSAGASGRERRRTVTDIWPPTK